MPTVIDSFIITLGLDPSEFDKGQKAAASAFLKTRDAATRSAKDIESASKHSADAIDRVTKSALGLFATLIGAKSIGDFIGNVTQTDVALSNLGANLDMSAQELARWEGAAQRVGDTAEGAASAIRAANDQLKGAQIFGKPLSQPLAYLFGASGIRPDIGPNTTTADLLSQIAKVAAADERTIGRSRTSYLLEQAGLGGLENLLLGGNTQAALSSTPAPSNESIANAKELMANWAQLQQIWGTDANNALMSFAPAAEPFIKDLKELGLWIGSNQGNIDNFAKAVADIANSLGQWRYAIEAILALLAGKSALGALAFILRLFGMGGLGTVVGGASRLLGPVAALATLGVDAWFNTVKQAGAGEDALLHSMGTGGEHEAYIRQKASLLGIDPDLAVKVARSEGLGRAYVGDDGSSFGDFQLHMAGLSGRFPQGGLGDEFRKSTGLDPRDPSTWQAQDDFALQMVRKYGWGPWSGARNQGITGHQGVSGSAWTAPWASAAKQPGNSVSVGAIHITINGGADANKIAANIAPAIKRAVTAQPANYGPA